MNPFYVIALYPDADPENPIYAKSGEWCDFDHTPNIFAAHRFSSSVEAQAKMLGSDDFTKRNVYSDGSSMPPSFVWSGLKINFANPVASGKLKLLKVTVSIEDIHEVSVDQTSGYIPARNQLDY